MNFSFFTLLLIFSGIIYCEDYTAPAYSYKGGWPLNPKSDEIEDPGLDLPCPGGTGCECRTNDDCDNKNCQAHPKGNYCVPKQGDLMPHLSSQFSRNHMCLLYCTIHPPFGDRVRVLPRGH